MTRDPTPDWNPRWSPDGARVAFYSLRSGQREIWVQPAAGGPARQVSRADQIAVYPSWSRDGRRLTFTNGGGDRRIVVLSSDGENAEGDNSNAEWSPDGRWITSVSNRLGDDQLWRVSTAGGVAQRIGGGPLYNHRWSPDGAHIYLAGVGTRAGTVWRMTPGGTDERPVTDLGGRRGYLESSRSPPTASISTSHGART
jgi:Tol biopolymer transport system component